ncbi:unnamed protein product [Clavelina lepadiformis]|uniref:Profilin n=1 Tax=Clavelina lepadiformis TaxID=159417 RepID=A0ABP0H298_CLALP
MALAWDGYCADTSCSNDFLKLAVWGGGGQQKYGHHPSGFGISNLNDVIAAVRAGTPEDLAPKGIFDNDKNKYIYVRVITNDNCNIVIGKRLGANHKDRLLIAIHDKGAAAAVVSDENKVSKAQICLNQLMPSVV